MAKAKTEGFRWLPSYYEAIRDLPDSERLAIYDAIIDYGFGNDVQELPPLLNGYFRLMQPSIEKSIRFEEKQKENGSKGGRPPKTQTKPKENPDETQNDSGENLAVAIAVADAVDIAVANDIAIEDKKRSRFVPPTVEEIRGYCRSRGNNVDPQKVYDYYEAADWKDSSGKPVRNWKQKIIAVWEPKAAPKQSTAPDLSWRTGG